MAWFTWVLLGLAAIIVASSIRIVYQFQKGVVFTLGKFTGIRGPGLNFVIPVIQRMEEVDMRVQTIDIPKQEVITKDNVTTSVNGVVLYKITDARTAIIDIQDVELTIKQYTQAILRDTVGNHSLDEVLQERQKIADAIEKEVEKKSEAWGVEIQSINIQDIELPNDMKRAMAKEAEAERVKRAAIIESDGEVKASKNLFEAAEMLARSSGAMGLRYLQTIRDIATNPSEKIILFVPSDAITNNMPLGLSAASIADKNSKKKA